MPGEASSMLSEQLAILILNVSVLGFLAIWMTLKNFSSPAWHKDMPWGVER